MPRRATDFAIGIGADRAEEAGEQGTGDTRLTDSSSLAEQRPSPLDLPERSYAQAAEFQEQRARETRMKATAEQFVGAPVVPTVGPRPEEEGTEGGSAQRRRAQAEAAGEEASEADRAQEMAQIQALEQRRQQSIGIQAAQEASLKGATKKIKTGWNVATGAEAISLWGIILAILTLNLQLIFGNVLNLTMVPKLGFWGTVGTVFLDLLLLAVIIMSIAIQTILITVPIILISGALM